MLGKLFGKKSDKKSGYFLELSEEEIAALPKAAKEQATEAVSSAVAAVSDAAEAVSDAVESIVTDAESAVSEETTSKKEAKAAASKSAPQEKAAPQKQAAPQKTEQAAPMTDTVELIRTAIAAAANKSEAAGSGAASTFDYRAPVTPARRRRPGPSMSPFKSMAKSVKRSSGF